MLRPILALLLVLVTMPTVGAEAIFVERTFAEDGGFHEATYDTQNYLNVSFDFNTRFYNTTGYDNDSISQSRVQMTYHVSEACAESLFLGNCPVFSRQTRQYKTSLLINGTDYLNATTTIRPELCFLCNLNWVICEQLDYKQTLTGQNFSRTVNCDWNRIGGSPNDITHEFLWRSISDERDPVYISNYQLFPSDNGTSRFTVRYNNDETGTDSIRSWDLGAVNFTNFTHSTSVQAHNVAGDAARTSLLYTFYTKANATIEANRLVNATAEIDCTFFFGLLPCLSVTGVLDGIFDLVHTVFSAVLGFFPGGSQLASFVSTVVTIIIGIPTFVILVFLRDPPQFLLFHTVFLLCLGALRYGTSAATDLDVIWRTPLALWRFLFGLVVKFAHFTYDMILRAAQLIRG